MKGVTGDRSRVRFAKPHYNCTNSATSTHTHTPRATGAAPDPDAVFLPKLILIVCPSFIV